MQPPTKHDPLVELRKLTEFPTSGVVSSEEFETTLAQILSCVRANMHAATV